MHVAAASHPDAYCLAPIRLAITYGSQPVLTRLLPMHPPAARPYVVATHAPARPS